LLDEFVTANRAAIIDRARARVAKRTAPAPTEHELVNGIPVFLDQLAIAICLARSTDAIDHEKIAQTSARHGGDLLRLGLTVGQVVHDYGDVCQTVTELAVEQRTSISTEEFRILNLCLDDAIAGAVTEYSRQREGEIVAHGTEHLGILAHEMRNLLNTAVLSFEILKTGQVAVGGSTSTLLGRSLMGLRDLIDRSLADVRLDVGIIRLEPISVAELVADVEIGAIIQAQARKIHLTVHAVEPGMNIDGDRQILAAALSNLLHNAFKFTRKAGNVSLSARAEDDRVIFDVEDECGGLPPGTTEGLFRSFEQRGPDRSGVGLGLSICLKAAKANGGEIRVRNLPGKGCVFTLDLPRKMPA
jgi:signal transduction histidine kinase